MPLFRTWAFFKEVEENDIIEFESLGFVDGEAEGVLQHGWYFALALLITDYDDLVASELQRGFFHPTSLLFLFLVTTKHVEEQLLIPRC